MTRETKVGLVIAGSFMCLVAVVVASKLQLAESPTKVITPEDQIAKGGPRNGEEQQQEPPKGTPGPKDPPAQQPPHPHPGNDKKKPSVGAQANKELPNPNNPLLLPNDPPNGLPAPRSLAKTSVEDQQKALLMEIEKERKEKGKSKDGVPPVSSPDILPLPPPQPQQMIMGNQTSAGAPTGFPSAIPPPGPVVVPGPPDANLRENIGPITPEPIKKDQPGLAGPGGLMGPKKEDASPSRFEAKEEPRFGSKNPDPPIEFPGGGNRNETPIQPGIAGAGPGPLPAAPEFGRTVEPQLPVPNINNNGFSPSLPPSPYGDKTEKPNLSAINGGGASSFPPSGIDRNKTDPLPIPPATFNGFPGPAQAQPSPPVAQVPTFAPPQPVIPMTPNPNELPPPGAAQLPTIKSTGPEPAFPGSAFQQQPNPARIEPMPQPPMPSITDVPPITVNPGRNNQLPQIPTGNPMARGPAPGATIIETDVCQASETDFKALSRRFYGSEKYADALQAYNRDNSPAVSDGINLAGAVPQLRPGQQVLKPSASLLESKYKIAATGPIITADNNNGPLGLPSAMAPSVPVIPASPGPVGVNPPTSDPTRNYQVQNPKGESILDVAERLLGNRGRWNEIYRLNPTLSPQYPIPYGANVRIPAN